MGLFAKTTSCLVKTCWMADGEDKTTTFLVPKERRRIGPYLFERVWRSVWIGVGDFKRRWKWPIMGSEGGLGGRLWFLESGCL